MGKNQNIRIKDIAKMAGVSVGTVDRVLHDRGNVSPKAEKKVRAILKKTNYSPNPIAQSLGAKKQYRIAVLLPNPEQDEYWELSNTGVLQAQEEWESYNIDITSHTFDLDNPESFSDMSQKLLGMKPHAVLTAPIFLEESIAFFEMLNDTNIPYILVNTENNPKIKKYNPLCIIGQNHHQSGRVAAELIHVSLQQPGTLAVMHVHENIENSIHLREKEQGFRDYYSEFSSDEFKIQTFSFLDEEESFESQIGDCIARHNLNGIFVPTSSGTYLTAKALEKYKKPQTKLVGYDLLEENIHYLENGTINFLINQDPNHQAHQGLSYLVNHLLLKIEVPTDSMLPLEIITRQSYTSFLNNYS